MEDVLLELTSITQRAAQAESTEAQMRVIVDAISAALDTDVCSLYLQSDTGDMVLVASHGLATSHPIVMPKGKGLVGRVVSGRHSINLKDPDKEPDYYYFAQSMEEQFHSFCGVPLVQFGRVTGVLVVQSRRSQLLNAQGEAFLTTLASHLALLVGNLPNPVSTSASTTKTFQGISGAPGLAVGEARVVTSGKLSSVPDAKCDNPTSELELWQALKAEVIDDLLRERAVVAQALGDGLSTVFDAYRLVLEDPVFCGRIEKEIGDGVALSTAIRNTVQYFSEQFKGMEDPYLRARHEDIEQLGEKIYQFWRGEAESSYEVASDGSFVLVGDSISVSDIVSLPADQLQAIVCFSGAALSHIAIFANALGIPAVMGVGQMQYFIEGERVIVDGGAGQFIRNPSAVLEQEYLSLIDSRRDFEQQLESQQYLARETKDGTPVELLANSGLQADIMPGIRRGADGVGLYRTEIPFMTRQSLPSEDEQVEVYRQVIDAYGEKPVYMRTLDIGGDKPLPYMPKVMEENPALGWRGVRFTLDNVQLLMIQLRAIVRAAQGKKSVRVLFPMVSTTEELDRCIQLLDDACRQLAEENRQVVRPEVGVMLEVPGAVSLLPFWSERLDFISIGSNDLSQYLLAIDRNNPIVGKMYEPLHPAVIHEIARIVKMCDQLGLPVSLCGELASDPVAVVLLIGMGVRRLSMSSARLPLIRWLVRSLTIESAQSLLRHALTLDNAGAIRREGMAFLDSLGGEWQSFLRAQK